MDGGRIAAGSADRQQPAFPGRVQLLTQKEDLRKLQSAQKNDFVILVWSGNGLWAAIL